MLDEFDIQQNFYKKYQFPNYIFFLDPGHYLSATNSVLFCLLHGKYLPYIAGFFSTVWFRGCLHCSILICTDKNSASVLTTTVNTYIFLLDPCHYSIGKISVLFESKTERSLPGQSQVTFNALVVDYLQRAELNAGFTLVSCNHTTNVRLGYKYSNILK